MAMTPSTMLPLGTKAPPFTLPDTVGNPVSLGDVRGEKGLLVMFICNHCPFVKHLRDDLTKFGREYQVQGLGVVAISSNDVVHYPDDHPDKMAQEALEARYTFPYLYDETQEVAKAYRAACTPDFFLFNADLELAYRGQFDSSRPGNGKPVTGADLRAAADAVVNGTAVPENQWPSVGCNIKWKPGNAPDYFAA